MNLLRIAALCAAGLAAHPALAATTTASGEAVIVAPNTLIKTDDLMFGSIIPSATSGTVTISSATGSARTSTGGATPVGGGYQRAEFAGMAQFGILENVTLASGTTTTLSRVGGGASMTATLAVEGGTGIRLFPGAGIQVFGVGGTLAVGANQMPGQYVGTFTLQVDYF